MPIHSYIGRLSKDGAKVLVGGDRVNERMFYTVKRKLIRSSSTSVAERVNQSINHTSGQSVDQSAGQSVSLSISQ